MAAPESAASLIERIGDLHDCAHSAEARGRAELSVKQDQPAFYGTVLVHRKRLLWSSWTEMFAVVADGKLRFYASSTAAVPEATYALSVRPWPPLKPGHADAPAQLAPHHGPHHTPPHPTPSSHIPPQSCTGGVCELEDCKADYYCFKLHAGGCGDVGGDKEPTRLRLCAGSSAEQMLWLQALTQGGVKYEEEVGDGSVSSLHDLAASDMMSGEQV